MSMQDIRNSDSRERHSLFPFVFEGYDVFEPECIGYIAAQFVEDYGPIRQWQSFTMVTIDYYDGTLKIYNVDEDEEEVTDDDPVMIIKFRCEPYDVWRKDKADI